MSFYFAFALLCFEEEDEENITSKIMLLKAFAGIGVRASSMHLRSGARALSSSSHAPLTEADVHDLQAKWANAIKSISKAYLEKGDYIGVAGEAASWSPEESAVGSSDSSRSGEVSGSSLAGGSDSAGDVT